MIREHMQAKNNPTDELRKELKWLRNNVASLEAILHPDYPDGTRVQGLKHQVDSAQSCLARMELIIKDC